MKESTSPRRITPVHGVWQERASSLWIPGGCHKPTEGQQGENDVLNKGLPRGEAAWATVPAGRQPVCQPLIRLVRLPELFHLIIRSLYPLTNISPFPPSPAPGNHYSLCLYELHIFQFPHTSEMTWYLSFSDLLHLTYCLEIHPCCPKKGRFPPFMGE